MKLRFSFLLAFAATLTLAPVVSADESTMLTIEVRGVSASKGGQALIGVYQSPRGWPAGSERVTGARSRVRGSVVRYTFGHLRPGRYAVVVGYDVNNNGTVDKNWVGLPAEPYGFSNGVRPGVTGAPSFESASFVLKGRKRVVVRVED